VFNLTFSSSGSMVGFQVIASSTSTEGPELAGFMATTDGHSTSVPPVTARFLRRLPVGEIETAARQHHLSRLPSMKSWVSEPLVARYAKAFTEQPRPGRRGRDARAYAEVAALYVEKLPAGAKTAVKDLAGELGYSPSQVRNVLYAARRRGLLTPAEPGKAGGRLTGKALDLLRHDEGNA